MDKKKFFRNFYHLHEEEGYIYIYMVINLHIIDSVAINCLNHLDLLLFTK